MSSNVAARFFIRTGKAHRDMNFWNIVWIIIGGAIIGIIARLLLRGRQNIPFWSVIVAGIVGMFVGDWLSGLFGVKETFGFDWIRHGLQIVVGMIAVTLVSAVFGRARAGKAAPATAPATAGAAASAGQAAGGAVPDVAAQATAAVDDAVGSAASEAQEAVSAVAGDTAAPVTDAIDGAAARAQGAVGDVVENATEAVTGAAGDTAPPAAP